MKLKKVDALRVSVTDRCNLRCVYCMPPEGLRLIPHPEILTFEEIARVATLAARRGARKVRLTGGEPLVRKDITSLVEKLSRVPGVADLPMTTNGVLLADFAADLNRAGLSRITVSLDTLQPDRFERITRRAELPRVLAGIEAALREGLVPLKINVVPERGRNDDEFLDFVALARERDIEVRFIERMPIGGVCADPDCASPGGDHIPSAEIRAAIENETGPLEPIECGERSNPARVFALPGGRGRIGFISALSEPFCRWCGRMRLTADGRLRPCLARDEELDIKTPMRAGADDDALLKFYDRAVRMKPVQDEPEFDRSGRGMSQIGG